MTGYVASLSLMVQWLLSSVGRCHDIELVTTRFMLAKFKGMRVREGSRWFSTAVSIDRRLRTPIFSAKFRVRLCRPGEGPRVV